MLTYNGIQFTNHAPHRHAFTHIFGRVCNENDIEHRLTKPNHLGPMDRLANRVLKEATVKDTIMNPINNLGIY
ncbi:hypothetical protein NOVO_07905 [Rickettsiales bacterium Ac37b]|nr:hypothetical protein NOVO_07905 [Rickettsiales bacterium Ac37b]